MHGLKIAVQYEFRSMTAEIVDAEKRIVRLTGSSELPVRRYDWKTGEWYDEVLSHEAGDINLTRMNDGGAVLDRHHGDQIAVVQKVEIIDRKTVFEIRFSSATPRADIIWKDVVDGIRRNVSVGYEKDRIVASKVQENGVKEIRFAWTPYELSFEPVPADPTVGVGRSGDNSQQKVLSFNIKSTGEAPRKGNTMNENLRKYLVSLGMDESVSDDDARKFAEEHGIRLNAPADNGKRGGIDSDRLANIYSLAARCNAVDEVSKMVSERKSESDILDYLLREKFKATPVQTSAEIGLSKKEIRKYSFAKAIMAQRSNNWDGAEFEQEVSKATEKHMKMHARGFMVPMDVLDTPLGLSNREAADTRDLIAGSTGTGKYTISTDLLMGEFIELLRNMTLLDRLGVRYLTGLRGDIAIPRLTGGNSWYWVAEQGEATGSAATFDQVGMRPHTLAGKTIYSRQFLMQSGLGVEAFVRYEIAAAIAAGLDEGAFYGTGSNNQPTGLFNISGINSVALGTNGAALTYGDLVAMETKVADANVREDLSMAYVTNAVTRGALKVTEMFEGTNGRPVWGSAPGSRGVGDVNGYPAYVSNLIKKNGTKGTGTNLSSMAFGKWSDLLVALWGALDVLVDPYSGSDSGDTKVVAFQSADFNVRHTQSFCTVTDIVTA